MQVSAHSTQLCAQRLGIHDDAFVALREVAEYLAGQTLSVDVETVNFAMSFPRFLDAFRFSYGS